MAVSVKKLQIVKRGCMTDIVSPRAVLSNTFVHFFIHNKFVLGNNGFLNNVTIHELL